MSASSQNSDEDLKPCPFCGAKARIESNRDWHRLKADHPETCLICDYEIMYPANEKGLAYMVEDWNQRSAGIAAKED